MKRIAALHAHVQGADGTDHVAFGAAAPEANCGVWSRQHGGHRTIASHADAAGSGVVDLDSFSRLGKTVDNSLPGEAQGGLDVQNHVPVDGERPFAGHADAVDVVVDGLANAGPAVQRQRVSVTAERDAADEVRVGSGTVARFAGHTRPPVGI